MARLIDANAFEEYHCNGCPYRREGNCTKDDPICATIQDLKDFPAVDAVEVVHGRWLFDSGRGRYFCSACNEDALYTTKDEPVYDYDWEENLRYSHTETFIEEHLTNYCPNCGAKMDGDSE